MLTAAVIMGLVTLYSIAKNIEGIRQDAADARYEASPEGRQHAFMVKMHAEDIRAAQKALRSGDDDDVIEVRDEWLVEAR